MSVDEKLTCPSLPWRIGSIGAFLLTSSAAKLFLKVGAHTEFHGLERFVNLLEERQDVQGRQRGLITVSNHVSVVDDPLIFGLLPYRFLSNPDNMRWSLGSHDICYKNGHYSLLSKFFMMGQTLPCHRLAHSSLGGLWQPSISQCIRLLSAGPYTSPTPEHPLWDDAVVQTRRTPDVDDPFTNPTFTYSTTGVDRFQAPSAFGTRRHAWVHIFPEGMVHQRKDRVMRYFKWGVARLILESEPCPTVVPMWVEGPDQVMHESRPDPRFIPAFGKKVDVTYGEPVAEKAWAGFRERWRKMKQREMEKEGVADGFEFLNEALRDGREATQLREEVTFAVREEVLKLRRLRGWPDEDPKARLIDTWKAEGAKREGKMDDDSWVKDT